LYRWSFVDDARGRLIGEAPEGLSNEHLIEFDFAKSGKYWRTLQKDIGVMKS
jgi:hypothetical protein